MRSPMFLGFLFASCVTTHSGPVHEFKAPRLNLSCALNPKVDSEHFKVVTCVFENVGDDWVDVAVESVNVAGAKVSTPEDTLAFSEAWSNQVRQDRYNTDLALGALMVGGLVLAAASGSRGVQEAGLAAAGGAAATGAGLTLRDEYRDVQYGSSYGKDHLLNGTMRLPPEGFVRRSALLEQEKGLVKLGPSVELCLKRPTTCVTLDLPKPVR